MEKLKAKYQLFTEWQQRSHQVAPISEAFNDCPTCGTHYQGNYCPRCGQSAKVGRYSLKKAFLLFLDVWGLGNRSMFRTLRDLLLRPGYMIRDYLKGMQMAYFPPFKMFFLLFALSLLVDSGLNIQLQNRIKERHESFEKGLKMAEEDEGHRWKIEVGDGVQDSGDTGGAASSEQNEDTEVSASSEQYEDVMGGDDDDEKRKLVLNTFRVIGKISKWFDENKTLVTLFGLLILSWPMYFAFRHCPKIPDMRFSEFFVAMVYTTNMMTVYSIVFSFLCIDSYSSLLPSVMAIVSLKQLSGYGFWNTAFRAVGIVALFFVLAIAVVAITSVLIGLFFSHYFD